MRKIKFRAWDGTRFLNKTFFDRNWYNSDNKCVKALVPEDQHYLKIMQYTGLKDKNGKEIYEGDIVKGSSNNHIHPAAEVVFMDGCFCATRYGSVGFLLNRFNEIEIIGNIYENPELLK